MSESARWSFWIDRGGTFTDVVAKDPAGRLHVRKLLSENREQYQDAPIEAIRQLLGVAPGARIPGERVEVVKMGTTVATNALLERKGARVALVINEGLADLLEIGSQERPEIFAREIRKPRPLARTSCELTARFSAAGEELVALDEAAIRASLEGLVGEGIEALAVVLMHSYRASAHEQAVGRIARDLGFRQVSLSHEVAPEVKIVSRGDTTTVDAYLTPILRSYVERVRSALGPDVRLRFMQSHGGLADADHFSGKDAILSGPAGGVVALAEIARRSGGGPVIGFDMGGTSTDVSRYDGHLERVYETVTAGVRVQAPMLNIVTVAAGGGSVLRFLDGRLTVGPESAGASPGPRCYRRAGPLAVTDANAALGRLQAEHFPCCFGPSASERIDVEAARAGFAVLAAEIEAETSQRYSVEELAAGFLRIANENMAKPIREISVARGYDVRDHALVCFGGAGAQHACAIADELGIRRVILHPQAGVLSALGMGLADVIVSASKAALSELDEGGLEPHEADFAALEARGLERMRRQGIPEGRVSHERSVDLRVRGVEDFINIALGGLAGSLRDAFEARHEALYGYVQRGASLELVNLRVETKGKTDKPKPAAVSVDPRQRARIDKGLLELVQAGSSGVVDFGGSSAVVGRSQVYFQLLDEQGRRRARPLDTPIVERSGLKPGAVVVGPALIVEETSTTVLEPLWLARVDGDGQLVLERVGASLRERAPTTRDPVLLEVFNNLFMSIAEQMGITLRKVSHSTNIKERLDFSCALFDGAGRLIANAPHIPVHLGAMGDSVRAIIARHGEALRAGDVYVTNDPYEGGSHLPDVTVVSPVYDAAGERRFFVANRGHHADIGGITPGSMPPFSRSIDEEGVRLSGFRLVSGGLFDERGILERLAAGPYPARDPAERLSDLRAQIAANQAGVRLLGELVERFGIEVVEAYMEHVRSNAAEATRAVIRALPDGRFSFEDQLDDGGRIALCLEVSGDLAVLDFTGTDPCLDSNLNAPLAVTRAAVLYAFRTLVPRPIPLNAGCLEPLELRVPKGSLLDPSPPAAVVGGNVETSQRVVDVVFGALASMAASQGTMNNLSFGSERFGYYETICGGAGAGFGFDGASAVHTHMTNTRITDPEVLERRCPVRLRRFAVRAGSGGSGVWRGGDGVVRELEFLEPLTASILSERRTRAPYGLHGADAGSCGRNSLWRDGAWSELAAKVELRVEPGDRLRIETPGGGGYDPSPADWAAMSPSAARRLFEGGRYRGPTSGIAAGRAQANLVVLPAAVADDFEGFCHANPRACPLLERLPPGRVRSAVVAPGADLRVALPRYRLAVRGEHGGVVWRDLETAAGCWPEDAVAFLIGCSFSFEDALAEAGLTPRHVSEGTNVPMYRSARPSRRSGPFGGALVVSMRPYAEADLRRVEEITARFPAAHGAPLHAGQPSALGIAPERLGAPDWGQPVPLEEGEVPVFWACGVTSQEAVARAVSEGAVAWALTHAPGHMLIGDLAASEARLREPEGEAASEAWGRSNEE